MASVLPRFNSYRVLHDYACGYYGPAARRGKEIAANDYQLAVELAEWRVSVHAAWPKVTLRLVSPAVSKISYDDSLRLKVDIDTAGLAPENIRVECVLRPEVCSELTVPIRQYASNHQDADGIRYLDDEAIAVVPLQPHGEPTAEGICRYHLEYKSPWCGALTYKIRAVPQHSQLAHPYETGLMRWL
jgi:starch phosphorylase